jgi:hypothetical protein
VQQGGECGVGRLYSCASRPVSVGSRGTEPNSKVLPFPPPIVIGRCMSQGRSSFERKGMKYSRAGANWSTDSLGNGKTADN